MTENVEQKTFTLKLSNDEIKLIKYWRESCHNYNDFCPLHCVKAGTDFCHLVTEHVETQIKEQKGENV